MDIIVSIFTRGHFCILQGGCYVFAAIMKTFLYYSESINASMPPINAPCSMPVPLYIVTKEW